MNRVNVIKWTLVILIGVLLIRYLSHLLLILLSSYILFSMLLPLKKSIQRIFKTQKHSLPSVVTLFFPFIFLVLIVIYVFPIIITQLNSLTYLSYEDVFENILRQFPVLEGMISGMGGKKYVLQSIQDTLYQVISINKLTEWSAVLLTNFSEILMNLLIVFFITFHFLKDEGILNKVLNALVSADYYPDIDEMSKHIKDILGRYFRGLLMDVFIVMILNTGILSLLGVKNGLLIGIVSGILNIIPYVGPLITLFIGLFMGVSGAIIEGHYEWIGGIVLKIVLTLVSVNILDGTILQPYIFSNVLKAHPLEIFLVIITAGMLGGIVWMMLAIPLYVIFKVVFTELLRHWKRWT